MLVQSDAWKSDTNWKQLFKCAAADEWVRQHESPASWTVEFGDIKKYKSNQTLFIAFPMRDKQTFELSYLSKCFKSDPPCCLPTSYKEIPLTLAAGFDSYPAGGSFRFASNSHSCTRTIYIITLKGFIWFPQRSWETAALLVISSELCVLLWHWAVYSHRKPDRRRPGFQRRQEWSSKNSNVSTYKMYGLLCRNVLLGGVKELQFLLNILI